MRIHLTTIAILLCAALPARADDACAGDRAKLCADAKGKAAMECMKTHEAELSDACKQQRASVGEMREEVHKDCQADFQKLCGTTKGRERFQCLRQHHDELSQPCKDQLAKARELAEQIHPGCKPDVAKLCATVEPGEGRIIACLQQHEADLTPACKSHLDKHAAKKANAPAK
jgi:hypothetical protein